MWQVSVALTGILSGLAQIVGKRQVTHMSAFQSGILRDVTTLVLVTLVYLGQPQPVFTWQFGVFFLMGVMESVSIAAYYSATREHMAATAAFSYPFSQLVIVGLAAVFFSEWKYFDPRGMRGMVNIVALLATIVLMVRYQGGKTLRGVRWSWMLILSGLVVAFSNIVAKWAVSTLGYSASTQMIYEFMGIVAGGLIFTYGRGLNMWVGWKNGAWGVVQGMLSGVGTLWYVGTLASHPLAIASVVRRVVIVLVTVTVGLWGFGEGKRMSRRQWMAVGVGVVVFALTSWANQ